MRTETAETKRANGVGNLVILGGSGDVGSRLARFLSDHGEWNVWAVSRRSRAVETTLKNVVYTALDVARPGAANSLPDDAIVVNLTEATPPELIAERLARGETVLDTSATPSYVDALIRAADGTNGCLVTGVGTAPGLSTLMAADLASDERVETLRIGLELGMGRHYGQAAAEWFFRTLGQPYGDPVSGGSVIPGTKPWRFIFERNEAPRLALDVAFPDEGIHPNGREVRVHHYLAVDPPFVTRLFAVAQWLRLGRWMSKHSRQMTKLSQWLPQFGQTRTRIAAVAFDREGKEIASNLFEGCDQADLTAAMIVVTLEAMRSGDARQAAANSIVDHLDLEQALCGLRRHLSGGAAINMNAWRRPK